MVLPDTPAKLLKALIFRRHARQVSDAASTLHLHFRCISDIYVRHSPMKGREFIRRVRILAEERNMTCRVDEKRGKGSHVMFYLGDRVTVVRNPRDELKTGTLHAMCKQLGIERRDL